MESVVGLFDSAERARRAAEAISQAGIPTERLSVLTPGSREAVFGHDDFRRGYERGRAYREKP